jgi:hypothetical protein
MSLDNNLSTFDLEQIFAMAQQLDASDQQSLAHRLLQQHSSTTSDLMPISKENTLLALLQSWEPLEEDFPDIDENLLELDTVNI